MVVGERRFCENAHVGVRDGPGSIGKRDTGADASADVGLMAAGGRRAARRISVGLAGLMWEVVDFFWNTSLLICECELDWVIFH